MRRLLRRWHCRLFGHPDTQLVWKPWQRGPETGTFRLLVEQCCRCRAVRRVAAVTWDEWHRRAG